jgi:stage II sporulation protein D
MMRSFFCFLLLSAAAGAAPDPGAGNDPVIRVAIARNTGQFMIHTSGSVYVLEIKTGQKYQLLEKSLYEVRYISPTRLAVAGQTLESPVKILAADGGDSVRLNGRFYKGDIYMRATETEKLEVVEHLSVEDYLCGVLPAEMSPDWPLEALKAQAVASRTYALKKADPKKDYDMTDGADTQVYNGASGMNERIREAVNSTRGEVLAYKGKLITAFFHACCGGHTAAASSSWGEEVVKPLYGVADPFCRTSSHYRWEFYATNRDLLSFIQSLGATAVKIKGVRVYQRDRAGRAVKLRFATDSASFTASAADLRRTFGTYDIKSTFITRITPVKGGYEFAGKGWGHGVGMCQEGAKFMANNGRTYKKILQHYYPGATITDDR